MTDTDHVVLLDDEGRAIGTAPKSSVHGPDTALHLAFSCHVLNSEGKVVSDFFHQREERAILSEDETASNSMRLSHPVTRASRPSSVSQA